MATDVDQNFILEFDLSVTGRRMKREEILHEMHDALTKVVNERAVLGVDALPHRYPSVVQIECRDKQTKELLMYRGIDYMGMHIELYEQGMGTIKVFIHDAPLDIPDYVIKEYLEEFGTVDAFMVSYYRKRGGQKTEWKDGTRIAKVRLNNPQVTIPPSARFQYRNKLIYLSFYHIGQTEMSCRFCHQIVPKDHECERRIKRCYICNEEGHLRINCPNILTCRGCNQRGHGLGNCPNQFPTITEVEVHRPSEKQTMAPSHAPGAASSGVGTESGDTEVQNMTPSHTPGVASSSVVMDSVSAGKEPAETSKMISPRIPEAASSGTGAESVMAENQKNDRNDRNDPLLDESQMASTSSAPSIVTSSKPNSSLEPKEQRKPSDRKRKKQVTPKSEASKKNASCTIDETIEVIEEDVKQPAKRTDRKPSGPYKVMNLVKQMFNTNTEEGKKAARTENPEQEIVIEEESEECEEVITDQGELENSIEEESEECEEVIKDQGELENSNEEKAANAKINEETRSIYENKEDRYRIKMTAVGASNMSKMHFQEFKNVEFEYDNLSIGGLTINLVEQRVSQISPKDREKTEIIIVDVGACDFDRPEFDKEEIIGDFKNMCQRLKTIFQEAQIIISGIRPLRGQKYEDTNWAIWEANESLEKWCTGLKEFGFSDFHFINSFKLLTNEKHQVDHSLYEDHIHLNESGLGFIRSLILDEVGKAYFKLDVSRNSEKKNEGEKEPTII